MNPLDWPLIAGPLPVILLVSALLALAWLVAGRNASGHGSLWHGMRGGRADGAASVRWLAICVPLIVMAAAGVIALLTWLINNVWQPFPDSLPFTIVLWSWVALVGMLLAFARQPLVRTWPRRAAAIAAGVSTASMKRSVAFVTVAPMAASSAATRSSVRRRRRWRC